MPTYFVEHKATKDDTIFQQWSYTDKAVVRLIFILMFEELTKSLSELMRRIGGLVRRTDNYMGVQLSTYVALGCFLGITKKW